MFVVGTSKYFFFFLFSSFFYVSVSSTCNGGLVFLAAISNRPQNKGLTWTEASNTCTSRNSTLLKPAPAVNSAYFQCVQTLLRQISVTSRTHLHAWSSDCNPDNSACAVYDINYFDKRRDIYRRDLPPTTADWSSFSVCHKGVYHHCTPECIETRTKK